MVVEIMAGEWAELFNELLFGAGAWLGLGIIISLAFLVSWKVKYMGLIWAIILIFLGIEYINHVSTSSNFMWSIVICFISAIILILKTILDVKH